MKKIRPRTCVSSPSIVPSSYVRRSRMMVNFNTCEAMTAKLPTGKLVPTS